MTLDDIQIIKRAKFTPFEVAVSFQIAANLDASYSKESSRRILASVLGGLGFSIGLL